ncbi:hypothetical protein JCM17960_06430 [Magnetospira thiophila]
MSHLVVRFFGLLVTFLLLAGSAAQALTPPDTPASCRESGLRLLSEMAFNDPLAPPSEEGTPVVVDVGLFLHRLTVPEGQRQNLDLDVLITEVWCDPRLASVDMTPQVLDRERAEQFLRARWSPDLAFLGAVESPRRLNLEVVVHPDGTLESRERLAVSTDVRFDLLHYPFDRQNLKIALESFAWPAVVLTLNPDPARSGVAVTAPPADWRLDDLLSRPDLVREVRDPALFSRLVFSLRMQRDPTSALVRIVLPLLIVVGGSWLVFWMGGETGRRHLMSISWMLAVLALRLLSEPALPRPGGLSYLDAVTLWAFTMVTATLGVNVLIGRLHTDLRLEKARSLDDRAKVVMPVIFISGLVLLTGLFFE